jgi:hypothetical protein
MREFTTAESKLDQYWPLGFSAISTTKEEGKKGRKTEEDIVLRDLYLT